MTSNPTLLDTPSAFRSLYWPVAGFLAALCLILWIAGFGPNGRACQAPVAGLPASEAPPVTVAPAAVAAAPTAPAPAAALALPPTEKLYFAINGNEVGAEGLAKLDKIVAYLKASPGSRAVLSGFHDPRGNRASNEELALNRARAVRAALVAAGIPSDRVDMAKPSETTGGGMEQEARRVEVTVKP